MMSSPEKSGSEGYTEEILEAYVLGHLAGPRQGEVQRYVEQTGEGAARWAQAQANIAGIHAVLQAACVATDNRQDDFVLASYLDNALEAEERAELETHLTCSPHDLARLVALYRETKTVLDPARVIRTVESLPAGQTASFEEHRRDTATRTVDVPGGPLPVPGETLGDAVVEKNGEDKSKPRERGASN